MRSGLLLLLLALPSFAQVRVSLHAPITASPMIRMPALPSLSLGAAAVLPTLSAPTLSAPALSAAPLPLPAMGAQDFTALPASAERDSTPAPQSPEQSSAAGAQLFDGAASLAGSADSAVPVAPLPASISVADPKDAAWLASVIAVARQSRTGRRVLKQIDGLLKTRGRPLTMVVTTLGANNGEYVYDWEILRMGAHYRKGEPAAAAPILVHELLHVVQKEYGLPTDALELELEAFAVTLMVYHELGLPLPPRSFEKQVDKNFRGPLKDFVSWLAKEYKTNLSIRDGLEAYQETLEERAESEESSLKRLEKRLAKQEAIIQGMRDSGQPSEMIKTYAAEQLGPIKLKMMETRANLKWARRDLDLLSTPEGVARYRAYAARVNALLRRYQKTYAERYPKR